MAEKKKGRVVVAGRFPAGCVAQLWRVASEAVLTHSGGELVDTKKSDEGGVVRFSSDVEVGARYIVFGYVEGVPTQVRAIGGSDGHEVLAQAPVRADVVKHADGQEVDGVHRPRRYPEDRQVQDEPDQVVDVDALKGKELAAAVKAAGVEGASSMTADEKRAALRGSVQTAA